MISFPKNNSCRKHTFHDLTITTLFLILGLLITGCEKKVDEKFKVYGQVTQDFQFYNQDNQLVTKEIFTDKVYVTDFFFTTCTTICPLMKRQMHRVYQAFADTPGVLLFSHTIDPEHDTVEVLKNYADGLEIKTDKWQLVTGPQEEIFAMAKDYMLGVLKDDENPDGYIHSGHFVLVDTERRIRGYYSGTDAKDVDRLIADLREFIDAK
ncbi:MAG: protein SCO1/2 [Desulforhopalus sp.]|jgi:protein SCO1/2